MQINFTTEEKKQYLDTLGYTVEDMEVFTSDNVYHNKVEFSYFKVPVAYKGDYSDKRKEKYSVEMDIGIDRVFEKEFKREIKEKILGL